jgi:biopolymer transport protein ExbD
MGFGNDIQGGGDMMSEINMTPLVDVMLVLLIIFIITIPVIHHSVKLDLPRATNQLNETKPETVNLSIDISGQVYWNGSLVTTDDLRLRVIEAARRQPQPDLRWGADRKTPYEKVIQVMAAAQSGGLEKIGFITEPQQ